MFKLKVVFKPTSRLKVDQFGKPDFTFIKTFTGKGRVIASGELNDLAKLIKLNCIDLESFDDMAAKLPDIVVKGKFGELNVTRIKI